MVGYKTKDSSTKELVYSYVGAGCYAKPSFYDITLVKTDDVV